jgi:TonB-dependent starch-binding outer membrane protein SusC
MRLRTFLPVVIALLSMDMLVSADAGHAQGTGTVTGTVRSGSTQQPVPSAQVVITRTNISGLTNPEGQFLLQNVPAGTHVLRVETLGFTRRDVEITVVAGQTTVAEVVLSVSAITLGEIVVTGTPGAQTKRELGNSIGSIRVGEQLENAPITNAAELLTARTPGLSLMSNSGQAGSSSNIRIRGAGSLSGGYQPVFYVDGIRIESGVVEGASTYQGGSALDFLNPDDIESIEVIRGPAAATLYGADAANGVIQIITKKGSRTGGARWTASYEVGENEWVRSISGDNYVTYRRCTVANQSSNSFPGCQVVAGNRDPATLQWWGKDSNGRAVLRSGIPEEDIIRIPGSNEFILKDDPLFRHPATLRTGQASDLNVSVRGGAQALGYFLSFNKSDEEGVFFNNFSNRMGGRGNFDFEASPTLNFATQFAYVRTHLQQPLNNNASNGIIRNAMRGRARAQSAPWEPGFLGFSPGVSNEFDNQNRIERTTIGLTGNWQPISWLRNRLTLGMDRQNYVETGFTRQDTTGRAPWGAISATGTIGHTIATTHRWTADYAGTAEFRLRPDLTSATSGGLQLNARKRRVFGVSGQGLVANNLNLISAAASRNASESISEQTSLGFFFEERLAWRDRVYLTGALRFDDNSAFGSNFEMVVYPKASVAWIISEEDFFDFPAAEEVKLRMAWGRAGNAPDPFTADRTFTSGQGVVGDALVNTLTVSAYGNPNLKAETGQEWEAGLDASLLGGRLGVEFTYYNQKTVDALISVPDPRSTGFTGSHLVNIGEIANSGLELLLTGSPLTRDGFGWDATLALSTNKNELVSFNGVREEIIFGSFADVQRHREGYPLGGFWAVDVERDASGQPVVRNSAGEVIANPVLDASGQSVNVLSSCRWAPADPTWNREAECNDIYVGPSRPTREIAATSTFTLFRDFRVYTQFDYRGGHYQWCASCSLGTRSDLNTWEVSAGGTALAPDISVADVLALRSLQTRSHISKADNLKWRELSLTWSVPRRWTERALDTSQMSVTLAGRNLAMWTKYEGKGDPEVQFNPNSTFAMLDYASTPQTRRLSASVRVSF